VDINKVEGVRDVHQQLLVGIAAELGLGVQSLVPRLFADFASRARGALVQCVDGVKIDLAVEAVLQGWRDVVRVIVGAVGVAVVMAVTFVFVVAVRHGVCSALLDGCLNSSHVCELAGEFQKFKLPIHVIGILTRAS
jgi:hypothetical protein